MSTKQQRAAALAAFNEEGRATIDVDQAAHVLGISRGAAYEAARRGDIPTLRFGRRLVVPVAGLRAKLNVPGRA